MKPSTIQLLKENPEAFKEVAIDYGMYYCTHESFKDEKVWNSFLSEALKPDWEILEFKPSAGSSLLEEKIVKLPDGTYNYEGLESGISLDSILNGIPGVSSGDIYIHSVRRSDGEVFAVDTVTNLGVIKGFKISKSNEMIVDIDFKATGLTPVSLACLTKLKPLFKTEDGKDYYKGDPLFEVYGVNKDQISEISDFRSMDVFMMDLKAGHRLAFSTRSAAEQWVEDHRPSVSIAQIQEFAEKDLPFQTVEALLLHLKSKK